MLRVCTSVRSTMPIHVATVVAPSTASSSTGTSACRADPARPREEPAPAAVGVVLVAEAAHEAANTSPGAKAEHGGARGRV